MESVEEAISALRLKIEETKKIRRRQETELLELTNDRNMVFSSIVHVCIYFSLSYLAYGNSGSVL